MSNKEKIKLLEDAMSLLYDTINPMPKSQILNILSKLKLELKTDEEIKDLNLLVNANKTANRMYAEAEKKWIAELQAKDELLEEIHEKIKSGTVTMEWIRATIEQALKGGDK